MVYTTDTSSIRVDIQQEELLQRRTPLLLLHSALGTRKEFDRLLPFYEDRAVITLDFPSHGESTTSLNAISSKYLASQVESVLLSYLQIPSVDIIGYSMGGYIGAELALMSPDLVRSLTCHAMKFYWTTDSIADAVSNLNPVSIKAKSEKGYAILSQLHNTNGFERTALLAASIIQGFETQKLKAEDLQRISCRLLLSTGDSDKMVTPEEVAVLYTQLPKEKTFLAIHPNSQHPFSKLDLGSFTAALRMVIE